MKQKERRYNSVFYEENDADEREQRIDALLELYDIQALARDDLLDMLLSELVDEII